MDKQLRNIIHKADKYIRWKKYRCLVPGCKDFAILSHAIPRSSCEEALADNGVLYTLQQSFTSMIKGPASTIDPPEVVETGVKNASVFPGFCAKHDSLLFRSAEIINPDKKHGMFIALHLRSLAFEYSRKRRNADFYRKVAELIPDPAAKLRVLDIAKGWGDSCTFFEKTYLKSIFNFMGGAHVDQIEYFCLLFARNLEVSCCGMFPEDRNSIFSNIAYNLISYADMSILVLTVFKDVEKYLDSFLARYPLPRCGEELVNDLAFSKGEEPLIAARLWRSLADTEKFALRTSLLHPDLRIGCSAPRIIRLARSDFASKMTLEMLQRLPPKLANALQ